MSAEPRPAPLPVGSTLDRGFALLRRNLRPLLVPQLILNIVPLAIVAVLAVIGYLALGDVATHTESVRESTFFGDSELVTQDVPDFTDGQYAVIFVFAALAGVIYLWFVMAAYVSVVRGAQRAIEGEARLPLSAALREALAATPRLFGLGVVFVVSALVALGVAGAVVVGVAELAGSLALLVGLAVFLAAIYVGVRLFLWPIVAVTEDLGLAAFGRTWRLTAGRFWSALGLLMLLSIVLTAVYLVVSLALELALGGLSSIDSTAGTVAYVPYAVLVSLFGVLFTAGYIAPLVVAHRVLAGVDGGAGVDGEPDSGSPSTLRV